MRLLISFHYLKLFLKLKQIFNLIKTTISVRIYSLHEIAFIYYKMSVINLYNVLKTRKLRKRAFIIKKIILKILKSKIKLCYLQEI